MAFTTVATDSTIFSVSNFQYDKDLPPYPHKQIFVKSNDTGVPQEQENPLPSINFENQQTSDSTISDQKLFKLQHKIALKDFKPLPPLKDDYHSSEVVNITYSTSRCRTCGRLEPRNDYLTFCGLFWCIILFPFGILCLILCKKKKCSYCGTQMY